MIVTDENYIDLLKQKDQRALEYFIDKDGWIVKSILFRSALPHQERMDCMNDTFFAIWQNAGRYDEAKASFTTWVAGVTRYCILNYLKKLKRIEYLSLDQIWETSNWEAGQLPVYELEEKEQFQHLLRYLPPEDQQIFLKLFWEDKSYEEVSDEMKIGRSVLYNRVSRGKRRLRNLLKRREENEGYI